MPVIPSLVRQEEEALHESEISLGYVHRPCVLVIMFLVAMTKC